MGARSIAALVFALVALAGFIVVDRLDGDADTEALEQSIAAGAPCPGEPRPPVTCRRTGDGWRCRIGGEKPATLLVPSDGQFEISKIC